MRANAKPGRLITYPDRTPLAHRQRRPLLEIDSIAPGVEDRGVASPVSIPRGGPSMGKQSITANDMPTDRLIPAEPMLEGAGDLTRRLQGLLDGQPKDDATVSRALDGMNDLLDEIA